MTIGNSVTPIGSGTFWGCSGLEKIVVEAGNPDYDSREDCNAIIRTSTNELVIGCKNTHIPNSVTSIGDYAFRDCSGLTELTIPNSVTSIGNKAFRNCSGLTELTIPNSVTSISDEAFYQCSGLTELTIPSSVTSIGDDAFYGCRGLTELTIPSSVTSIGNGAFYGCSGLTEVTSLSTTPPAISSSTFDRYTMMRTATLHVLAGCKEAYAQEWYWRDFLDILEDAVDGIAPVVAGQQAKPAAIYTLDGVKLNATSLRDLPSGVYVINGKKVIVK